MPTDDDTVAGMIASECSHGDVEIAHSRADELIVQLLRALGYEKTVTAWEDVDKWYA